LVFTFFRANLSKRTWTETKYSLDNIAYTRYGQEVVLQQNPYDGKNFTFRMFVDVTDTDTFVEFLGFKVPLTRERLKVSTEFENYPKRSPIGEVFDRPAVFAHAKIDISVRPLTSTGPLPGSKY
jgi:hypothetical protein